MKNSCRKFPKESKNIDLYHLNDVNDGVKVKKC